MSVAPQKAETRSAPAAPAKAAPKKPAKKVVKSWPAVNALITLLSLTGTLGGWAHFTVQEMRQAEVEAAQWSASQAVVAPAAPPDISALPPVPTVVPPPDFNGDASTEPAPAPAPAPAAPALRSVTAPPPAPVASTRSSR